MGCTPQENDAAAILGSLQMAAYASEPSAAETADYIGSMLVGLEGMAAEKGFDTLARLIRYARLETQHLL